MEPGIIPMENMRAIVCGGRNLADRRLVWGVLNRLTPVEIAQGGARGADALAREWAEERGVPCTTFEAEWSKHGPSAGPKRNQRMLDEFKPALVIAFPGGRGTADMVRRGRATPGMIVLHIERAESER